VVITQAEEYRSTGFYYVVERPCVAPVVEARFKVDVIEGSANVRNDPLGSC
jgi:hypothetical protein